MTLANGPRGRGRIRSHWMPRLASGQMSWRSQFCSCRTHPGSTIYNRPQHIVRKSFIRKPLICIAFAERLIPALGTVVRIFSFNNFTGRSTVQTAGDRFGIDRLAGALALDLLNLEETLATGFRPPARPLLMEGTLSL